MAKQITKEFVSLNLADLFSIGGPYCTVSSQIYFSLLRACLYRVIRIPTAVRQLALIHP